MRSIPRTWAALAVVVALALPSSAWAGAIKGTVVLAGPAPPSTKLNVTIDQYVCGTEKDAGDLIVSPQKTVRNAVVWLENPPPGGAGPKPAPASTPAMDQKECVFVPRVVVVPAGGTVEFLNSDRLLHNLHATPQHNPPFNRTQPKGRTIPITFPKPEIIRVNCDLHSWMRAWVVVAPHPWYVVTGDDGAFAFDALPPGQYTVNVW
ncbi:MAG TPA: carboxypeptidase regulatory-like domain-containing protein, partial [Candidatus Tectomicrobia bacterium]|nr:carboxypeptidase regulatory-like domain-containing protein [Candidatus Tectomicrobia bacterium]